MSPCTKLYIKTKRVPQMKSQRATLSSVGQGLGMGRDPPRHLAGNYRATPRQHPATAGQLPGNIRATSGHLRATIEQLRARVGQLGALPGQRGQCTICARAAQRPLRATGSCSLAPHSGPADPCTWRAGNTFRRRRRLSSGPLGCCLRSDNRGRNKGFQRGVIIFYLALIINLKLKNK